MWTLSRTLPLSYVPRSPSSAEYFWTARPETFETMGSVETCAGNTTCPCFRPAFFARPDFHFIALYSFSDGMYGDFVLNCIAYFRVQFLRHSVIRLSNCSGRWPASPLCRSLVDQDVSPLIYCLIFFVWFRTMENLYTRAFFYLPAAVGTDPISNCCSGHVVYL